MKTTFGGNLTFVTGGVTDIPAHGFLVYGSNNFVPPNEVHYGETSIAVIPQPGIMLTNDGTLLITGSTQRDQLTVKLSSFVLTVNGTIGQTRVFRTVRLSTVHQIIAALDAGNDSLKITGSGAVCVLVDGGEGNDAISTSSGPAVLVGGRGDDILIGSGKRDILIGGEGRDQLTGGPGEDILIDGSTTYDQNRSALTAIQQEWLSTASRTARIANLATGAGPYLSAAAISLQAGKSVLTDSNVDLLFTDSTDWIFSDPRKDLAKSGL